MEYFFFAFKTSYFKFFGLLDTLSHLSFRSFDINYTPQKTPEINSIIDSSKIMKNNTNDVKLKSGSYLVDHKQS